MALGQHVFDLDTQIKAHGEDSWQAQISSRWNAGSVPNGGYLMALASRMISTTLQRPDPLSLTGHFLQAAQPGGVIGQLEVLRSGRSLAFATVTFSQPARGAIARFTGVYGDLDRIAGETRIEATPPSIPPPEACRVITPLPIEVARRFERRVAPDAGDWLGQGLQARAELCAWLRFSEPRDQCVHSVLLSADALPPPLLAVFGARGWVPTLELTVQVRRRPAPGWLLCRTRTRYLTDGLLENDGEFWDSSGKIVALARQLARFAEPGRSPLRNP